MTTSAVEPPTRGGAGRLEPAVRLEADFEEEFPGASRPASAALLNLVYTGERILAEMARLFWAHHHLSVAGALVLATLEGAGEPLTPTTISARLLITSGSVTSLLDTLEKRGLVRRTPHPVDRRSLLVEITDDARDVVDRLLPEVHAWERDLMAVLSATEQATLLRLLAKVGGALKDLPPWPSAPPPRRRHTARLASDGERGGGPTPRGAPG